MEKSAYELMAKTEATHWWFSGRRSMIKRQLARMKLPADATIIELGAGTGGNLRMLAEFGSVSAMELDDDARAIARESSGVDVKSGRLPEDIPFADQSANVVALFDVLEHVEQDEESLRAIRRLLRPGGKVFLTVPAHQWLWSHHDEVLHHFRRYSKAQLEGVAVRAGYKVERIGYFNMALFPVAAAIRMMNRPQKDGDVAGGAQPAGPVNAALKTVLKLEGWANSYVTLPFGLSLVTVLEA